jgi:DNA end-binding protein Ku
MRSAAEYFIDIPELQLPPEMLELAEHIVGTKARDFNPAFLTDHYRAALVELLKEKGAAPPAPEATPVPSQQNVVSLMDTLKRSLAAEAAKTLTASPSPPKAKRPKKAAAGQREMLLPIAGKGPAKEPSKAKAKEPAGPAARQRKTG